MNVVIYPREVYCRNRYVTALTNEILYTKNATYIHQLVYNNIKV